MFPLPVKWNVGLPVGSIIVRSALKRRRKYIHRGGSGRNIFLSLRKSCYFQKYTLVMYPYSLNTRKDSLGVGAGQVLYPLWTQTFFFFFFFFPYPSLSSSFPPVEFNPPLSFSGFFFSLPRAVPAYPSDLPLEERLRGIRQIFGSPASSVSLWAPVITIFFQRNLFMP